MPRYLFGPVTVAFADQNLHQARASGECLTFGPQGPDLVCQPDETWDKMQARLPKGWCPEFIVLWLPYTHIPEFLWSAPIPIVGLAADWNLLWHEYRQVLPRCDTVFTDAPGVEVMKRAGLHHVRAANLFGLERAFLEESRDVVRDIDICFVGNIHQAVQCERLPWLGRLARLADRYRVLVATGLPRDGYRSLLCRARIAFNRSVRGECNRRVFESAACGALLFQEKSNKEVAAYFEAGKEYVEYTD